MRKALIEVFKALLAAAGLGATIIAFLTFFHSRYKPPQTLEPWALAVLVVEIIWFARLWYMKSKQYDDLVYQKLKGECDFAIVCNIVPDSSGYRIMCLIESPFGVALSPTVALTLNKKGRVVQNHAHDFGIPVTQSGGQYNYGQAPKGTVFLFDVSVGPQYGGGVLNVVSYEKSGEDEVAVSTPKILPR